MKFTFLLIILLCPFILLCQKKFSLEANYGLNGNFFVRSYEERNVPGFGLNFYKKNFIGTIGGVELKYKIGKKSNIGLGYSNSVNSRTVNYISQNSSAQVAMLDFSIQHINNFYQLYYERPFLSKKQNFQFNAGVYYLRMQQQEVDITPNSVLLEQRNFKNSKLEEGGFFLGFHYSKQIENRFRVGIRSRFYYTASTNQFEAITLTPTLSYQF